MAVVYENSVFRGMEHLLEAGRKAHEHIQKYDVPKAAEDMTDECTFIFDWVDENLPLEDAEGQAMDKFVREQVADAMYQECPPQVVFRDPPEAQDILVFCDQLGLTKKVIEAAPEGRVASTKWVTQHPRQLTKSDVDAILATRQNWDMIVIGYGLNAPKSNSVPDVLEENGDAARFFLYLLQYLSTKDGVCDRVALLTHDIFSEEEETHKEKGLGLITHSTLYGMANTARSEMDSCNFMFIDIEMMLDRFQAPDPTYAYKETIPMVMSELFREATWGVNTVRIRYPYSTRRNVPTGRPAGRYVIRQVCHHLHKMADCKFAPPDREGVIAISGGNGALGLVFGDWILQRCYQRTKESGGTWQPKFSISFLSRSQKITENNAPLWDKVVKKAKEVGVPVSQDYLDMATQESVDEYLAKVTPNLLGFIHSAGVLRDSMIPNQTWEKFEAVFDSKHRAAAYLHDGLERYENPLEFYWVFSSAAVQGSMGQLNYSGSNAFLDGLARHRRAMGKPCVAMQWGAWGEVGMAATLDDYNRRRMQNSPMPYFTVAQGLAGLEGGLQTGLPGFTTFIVNPPLMYGLMIGDEGTKQQQFRNFSSLFVPHPAPSHFGTSRVYDVYRMYRYICNPHQTNFNEWLVWKKFIGPRLAQPEDDDVTSFMA